jgi:hypothetical protein
MRVTRFRLFRHLVVGSESLAERHLFLGLLRAAKVSFRYLCKFVIHLFTDQGTTVAWTIDACRSGKVFDT